MFSNTLSVSCKINHCVANVLPLFFSICLYFCVTCYKVENQKWFLFLRFVRTSSPKLLMNFSENLQDLLAAQVLVHMFIWMIFGWVTALDKNAFLFVVSSKSTSVTNLVRTIPQELLVRFHPNFTGMISTKSNCACYQHFPV